MQVDIEVIKSAMEELSQQDRRFSLLAEELEDISGCMEQGTLWTMKKQLEQTRQRLDEEKSVFEQMIQTLDNIIWRYKHSEQRIVDDYSGDRIIYYGMPKTDFVELTENNRIPLPCIISMQDADISRR